MTIRVGINGFGRIGRNVFRAVKKQGADIDFVAANDLGSKELMAHLLQYDTILGRWDGSRIEQVLTNLLSNACRYSPPHAEIVVRARANDRHAIVEVIDHGPGIAPDQQQKLFTPFFRGAAASRHKGGLGLGLYITREIVRRHGGSMRVSSTPGQGATFSFELPLRPTS